MGLYFFSLRPIFIANNEYKNKQGISAVQIKHPPMDYIALVMDLAQKNKLLVQAINLIQPQHIRLSVITDFPAFLNFLAALNRSAVTVILMDFDWHVENQLVINTEMIIFAKPSPVAQDFFSKMKKINNPFVPISKDSIFILSDGT
jgi:hypothetical protein